MPPRLQPPLAAYHSAWYIERPREELRALEYLDYPGQPAIIWGHEHFGKTWLMRHLIQRLRTARPQSVVIDLNLDLFDKSSWRRTDGQSLDKFLREFALHLAKALGVPAAEVDRQWHGPSPIASLNWLMHSSILPTIAARDELLYLAIDRADAVLGTPLQTAFFGMLRAWAESEGLWSCLRLILSVSTLPALLIENTKQSPFNLTDPIALDDFDDGQLMQLAKLHQLDWNPEEWAELGRWVSGHPYLTRLICYHVSREKWNLTEIFNPGTSAGRIFDHFLERLESRLRQQPELLTAWFTILDQPNAHIGEASISLLRAGLLRQSGPGIYLPRYLLYRRIGQLLSGDQNSRAVPRPSRQSAGLVGASSDELWPLATRRGVRRLLVAVLVTDDDLNAFCLDYFPEIKQRFGTGMSTIAKQNLLLEQCAPEEILRSLRKAHPEKSEQHRDQLRDE